MFHSGMRAVSIELIKSHTPSAVLTKISIAPPPFSAGMARLGNVSAARLALSEISCSVNSPLRSASTSENGSGNRPSAASARVSTRLPSTFSVFINHFAVAGGCTCSAECG